MGQRGAVRFLWDGDRLIGEYDSSNNILQRHVHGGGVDEPVASYNGPAGGRDRRHYLQADERGSIVSESVTLSGSTITKINTYDKYGIPGANNVGRFQYTGQIWLNDIGAYYYKARIYSPTLGRFLQTDPIGHKGGINLYGYAASDPINFSDPTGLFICPTSHIVDDDDKREELRKCREKQEIIVNADKRRVNFDISATSEIEFPNRDLADEKRDKLRKMIKDNQIVIEKLEQEICVGSVALGVINAFSFENYQNLLSSLGPSLSESIAAFWSRRAGNQYYTSRILLNKISRAGAKAGLITTAGIGGYNAYTSTPQCR